MNKSCYLKTFTDLIDTSYQITHVCVPYISSNCITYDFIKEIKDLTCLNITIIPFKSILFDQIHETWSDKHDTLDIKDGLYILIDSNNEFAHHQYIYLIQRKINVSLKYYKKINNIINPNSCSWIMHYLSHKRHKWVLE